jgi:hypothetical protein
MDLSGLFQDNDPNKEGVFSRFRRVYTAREGLLPHGSNPSGAT